MSEETWHQARLIPTSGINGADEQEGRATSALLSVMSAVKEFSRTLLSPLGSPAGLPETYIEVPFDLDGKRFRPDGLIRVTRSGKPWTALVEVKTGRNLLTTEQVEAYLDIAREQGFQAVITISNEIPAIAGQHPTKLDKRKLRKVEVHHWSWSYLLATAVMQKEVRGVSDPEQAWILGELIRYLEHPRSGALEFEDMGPNWVPVRNSVEAATLRATDKTILDVTARFDALLRFASLRLGRQLGTEVLPVLSRKEVADPNLRTQALLESLVKGGELGGVIRIPNTVGPITLTANLRSGKVTAHVDLEAPRDGRATTRVNWLVRQLKNAPGDTRVESFIANARGAGAAELLSTIRENSGAIILDPKKDIRSFRVARTVTMGAKAGRGRGTFIDSVLDLLDTFYIEVVQHLKAWSAAPPKMREVEAVTDVEPSLVSTAPSSQDGPEDADEIEERAPVEAPPTEEVSRYAPVPGSVDFAHSEESLGSTTGEPEETGLNSSPIE